MPYIKWIDALNIGIPEIDEQHHLLIDHTNKLWNAVQEGNHKNTEVALRRGINYMLFHIDYEEKLMRKIDYDYFLIHKRTHEVFMKRVLRHTSLFIHGEESGIEMHTWLSNRLLYHILHNDREFASKYKPTLDEFYRKKHQGSLWEHIVHIVNGR